MRVLVLGGTRFVGYHIVDLARRDHQVTVFNRGRRPLDLPVEHLTGNRRTAELGALAGRSWDVVIDTSTSTPRAIRQVLKALGGRFGHYAFVSSSAVYDDRPPSAAQRITEDDPVRSLPPGPNPMNAETYGGYNARCETVLWNRMGSPLITRPSVMSGPRDYAGRVAYWLRRCAERPRLLGPSRPEQPVQILDARDHARFVVDQAVAGTSGTFNVAPDPITFAELISACAATVGASPEVVRAPRGFLAERDVELPLALVDSGEHDDHARISSERAMAAGLTVRPLADTLADLWAWEQSLATDPAGQLRPGPSPAEEDALLAELDGA